MTRTRSEDSVSLMINGRRVDVPLDDIDTPLLYLLRDHLGLKGTRFGCGTGLCGSCAVLVDGVPAMSCQLPVSDLGSRRIETVEGIDAGGGLDTLRNAFMEADAGQCGYCLNGILVAATALLRTTGGKDRDEIRLALDGHICRCGVHNRILTAVEAAAKKPK